MFIVQVPVENPLSPNFHLRLLNSGDLPFCRHLVAQANWNQNDFDWLRMLHLEPEGCFAIECQEEVIATTTSCRFEKVGWIAMVLVDPRFRGRGLAMYLVDHAIQYLYSKGAETILLDATTLGEKVYRKLGFKNSFHVSRWARTPGDAPVRKTVEQQTISEAQLDQMYELDRLVAGGDRREFLRNLVERNRSLFYVQYDHLGVISGFVGFRRGKNAIQVGPLVAKQMLSATELLDSILNDFSSQTCFIDIPDTQEILRQWAVRRGFTEQRSFVRMYLGTSLNIPNELVWVSSGPEKG